MNRRRILIVAIGVLILALVGGGIYLYLRNDSSTTDTDGTLPEIGGDFAELTPEGSDIVASTIPLDAITAYHASSDGSVVAIHRNGSISRIAGTTITSLSSSPIDNFASASFSADGSKILVLVGQQPRSQANIFDVATASWRAIPGTFRDAVWGPRGTQLATLTPDTRTGKTAIGIYDTATGRTTQTLATLALGDVSVAWPAPSTIIVADKPNARSNGNAWSIDIASKRVSVAARGRGGFTALWDAAGSRGISFETRARGVGGVLSTLNNGVATAKLAFTTLPEKCSFAGLPTIGSSSTPYVICAVPRDQDGFQLAELPDSWLRRQFFTDDVLIGINLETQSVDFSIAPPLSVDATRLQVVGNTIYYTDRSTDKLYKSAI